MLKEAAIQAIGKRMGRSKFSDYMSGSLMPRGDIDVASALKIIYGTHGAGFGRELEKAEKKEFERQRREQRKLYLKEMRRKKG